MMRILESKSIPGRNLIECRHSFPESYSRFLYYIKNADWLEQFRSLRVLDLLAENKTSCEEKREKKDHDGGEGVGGGGGKSLEILLNSATANLRLMTIIRMI